MLRPSDHADSAAPSGDDITSPRLGVIGWLRWSWRQLTSMRTALVLLLLLAIAAVPGSIVPQRGA
ncbi:cytochrome c biogenesis protein ResB, partial [Streptomyces roseofulvus]